jgi:hypothetical protein
MPTGGEGGIRHNVDNSSGGNSQREISQWSLKKPWEMLLTILSVVLCMAWWTQTFRVPSGKTDQTHLPSAASDEGPVCSDPDKVFKL